MVLDDSPIESGPTNGWRRQFQRAIRDPLELCDRLKLPEHYRPAAIAAAREFAVFAPEGYVRRMEVGNAHDPLLRQVLPLDEELRPSPGFARDPVGDLVSKQRPGLIQKYRGRVLLITTGLCAIHCRYCFRRHYPYDEDPGSLEAWEPALAKIGADTSIREVILSGGDPLSLSDAKLLQLTRRFAEMEHLRRLRVHTRLPIVIPERVTDGLLDALAGSRLTPYVVIHANHGNELDQQVSQAVSRLRAANINVLNQAVLLRGINDTFEALRDLCETLCDWGVLPYYLNQLDRVEGAAHFEVSPERGRWLVEELRKHLPGYAVPRYVQEIQGAEHKIVLR